MQLRHNDTLRAVASIAVLTFVAGCTTPTKTATEPKKETAKDQYTHQSSFGSWVPRKVKKTDPPVTDGSTTEVSPEALEKISETGRVRGNQGLSPTR